ncbi:MAG TPA: type II toxin-antitoxin system RelE/ParE family toxin [Spirochaetes bacterium]|nr:type II toxin-antitoxin system RelE/ParE family toxin [Spirochaetota bacterium]
MDWTIKYYKTQEGKDVLKDWIDSLEKTAINAIAYAIDRLTDVGIRLKEPHTKHLEGKLYELRIKDFKGIYRIIYFANMGKEFVLLHGYVKKTNKTPIKELEIARKRMKEVISNG